MIEWQWPLTNPVLIFATVMLIVLLAPPLFRRFGLPGLVGLIVSGAVVGPNALGMLQRGSTFELLGTVGLLYLMFTAGLSLDLEQFYRYKGRSLAFGGLSFIFPAGLAYVVGTRLLGFEPAAALLLGAVVGSHTLLAYPVASKLGIDKHPAVTMTMGGTMVTDVISLILLAAVSATVEGASGLGFWAQFAGLVTAFVVAVFWGLPRLGRWFFRTAPRQADLEFVFLLAVVFVVAFIAELVYLAPIIGAFLAGIALNPLVPERSGLMLRIEFVGDALFIPFFLISVGMLVDASVLLEGWTVGIYTLTFAALVWVGKAIAAWITKLLFGYSVAETWTIFGLSTPQAAATLAVTLVGFEIGLFDEAAVNAVVLIILLTALVGPWMVEKFGREVALEQKAEASAGPSAEPQRLLVPMGNPETAPDLMDLAVLLHEEDSEEPIYPMTVVRDGRGVDDRVADGEELLSDAVLHAADVEVPVVPLTRIDYNIAAGILRAITEERISTVVIGAQSDTTARSFVFGSMLDQLLESSEEMIVVGRFRGRLAANERLVLAIPPYADREIGFADVLGAFTTLARRAGLDIVLFATEETLVSVDRQLETVSPQTDVETRVLEEWRDLVGELDEFVEPTDVVTLVSEREGSVAWRPSLRRLPGLLQSRFAESTVLTAYMGEATFGEVTAETEDRFEPDKILDLIRPDDIRVFDDDAQPSDGLETLLAETLGPAEVSPGVVDALTGAASYAPEIRQGVALYHTHTDELAETRLLIVVSPAGWKTPQVSRPARVVLVLLGGRDLTAEEYVDHLSVATRLVHSDEVLDELVACTDAEQVRSVLVRRIQQHGGGNGRSEQARQLPPDR